METTWDDATDRLERYYSFTLTLFHTFNPPSKAISFSDALILMTNDDVIAMMMMMMM